jgi:ABC-type spermidine/putrescine transport system permease subunit I
MSAGSFLAPAILGGPGDFMMANVIEQTFTYNVEFAAAIAVLFTGVLLVLIGLLNWRANLTEVLESI